MSNRVLEQHNFFATVALSHGVPQQHRSWATRIVKNTYFLGVTSCPPSRTPYTHDVRIFYISSLSMLFDICEQCWYQRCVTSIEIGGDVLALGIRFI